MGLPGSIEHFVRAAADSARSGSGQSGSGQPMDQEQMKRLSDRSRDIAASFGQLVSIMMQTRQHKFTMLADLEWMILPAIATRQFRVAESVVPNMGMALPVAAVIWASVNDEADRRMAENLDMPVRLKPEEWRSGEHVWIIEAIGDGNAVSGMLEHLKQTELKDKQVRMRVRGKDGKTTIGRVEVQNDGAPAAG